MAEITLREVSKDNINQVLALKVKDHQTGMVAPNAKSIAQGTYEDKSWFRAIYADDEPVGFVMLYCDTEKPHYFLWRFLIDTRFQKMGFGWQAMQLVIEHVRTLPGAKSLLVSWVPAEGGPGPFYEKLGFEPTGEIEGDEVVARLDFA